MDIAKQLRSALDPKDFAQELLGFELDDWQIEFLNPVERNYCEYPSSKCQLNRAPTSSKVRGSCA